MQCPYCDELDTKVIDSRPTDEGKAIRRRLECPTCGKRFTTYEKVEETLFMVVKKDGSRATFDKNKILTSIMKACEKRPVSVTKMEEVVDDIEKDLNNMMEKEISSEVIGEKVMEELKNLDQVAYVRFASVYRDFKDVGTFVAEVEKLLDGGKKK